MNYSLIRTICTLVIGLVLVLWLDAAIDYIVITIGILFLAPGFIVLIGYFGAKPEPGVPRRSSIEGARSLLSGLQLVMISSFFADVLMSLLGFVLIMEDVQQVVFLSAIRRQMPVPGGFCVISVPVLIAGIIALFSPAGVRNTTFTTIGISSLVYAISELINQFKFARRRPKTPVGGEIKDAEAVE